MNQELFVEIRKKTLLYKDEILEKEELQDLLPSNFNYELLEKVLLLNEFEFNDKEYIEIIYMLDYLGIETKLKDILLVIKLMRVVLASNLKKIINENVIKIYHKNILIDKSKSMCENIIKNGSSKLTCWYYKYNKDINVYNILNTALSYEKYETIKDIINQFKIKKHKYKFVLNYKIITEKEELSKLIIEKNIGTSTEEINGQLITDNNLQMLNFIIENDDSITGKNIIALIKKGELDLGIKCIRKYSLKFNEEMTLLRDAINSHNVSIVEEILKIQIKRDFNVLINNLINYGYMSNVKLRNHLDFLTLFGLNEKMRKKITEESRGTITIIDEPEFEPMIMPQGLAEIIRYNNFYQPFNFW